MLLVNGSNYKLRETVYQDLANSHAASNLFQSLIDFLTFKIDLAHSKVLLLMTVVQLRLKKTIKRCVYLPLLKKITGLTVNFPTDQNFENATQNKETAYKLILFRKIIVS